MTDKQIIIDGVDIKDCKRRIGKDNFCRYYKRPCAENNYNCIWKKYLRKEQELQEAMDNYVQLDLQRVKEYNELVDLYKAKEQELQEAMDNYVQLDLQRVKEYNELVDLYKAKEQECEELKKQLERKEENYQKLLSKSNKYIHDLVDENVQDISNLARQLKQLKVDKEKLKKQVCGLRPELKYIIDKTCSKYNIEAKYYHEKIVEIINNLDKLSKTADEEIESLESEVRE